VRELPRKDCPRGEKGEVAVNDAKIASHGWAKEVAKEKRLKTGNL